MVMRNIIIRMEFNMSDVQKVLKEFCARQESSESISERLYNVLVDLADEPAANTKEGMPKDMPKDMEEGMLFLLARIREQYGKTDKTVYVLNTPYSVQEVRLENGCFALGITVYSADFSVKHTKYFDKREDAVQDVLQAYERGVRYRNNDIEQAKGIFECTIKDLKEFLDDPQALMYHPLDGRAFRMDMADLKKSESDCAYKEEQDG